MEKMDGKSMDLIKEHIEELKELFPSTVAEGRIDFEKLRIILGDEVDDSKEKYFLNWDGKTDSIRMAQSPSSTTLRPCKEKSKNWNQTENIYIEGDNLEVLKQLQKTYFGKIKMIYIDPPYNTGKDFVYKDNFTNSIEAYKEQTNQTASSNPNTSGRFHSDWLNMIYPRLVLARNLLAEDGVIFISIDDNEYANLEKICNEVFGESNRLETFHIQVRYDNKSLNEKDDFQKLIEYCLIYAKDRHSFKPKRPTEEYAVTKFNLDIKELKKPDKTVDIGGRKVDIFLPDSFSITKVSDEETSSYEYFKETWVTGSIYSGTGHGKVYQQVVEPRNKEDGYGVLYKIYGLGEDGLGYRYMTGPKQATANKGKMYNKIPLEKLEGLKRGDYQKSKPIINFYDYSPDFGNIRHEGGIGFNSGKKPTKMLKNLIDISNLSDGDIVLDFFSGSASTAHATMAYSMENNVQISFIMVQLPELDNDDAEFETICDLGEERIRRAGAQLEKEWNTTKEKEGLFSKQTEYSLDTGFKVFKLDSTNLNPWDNIRELDEQTLFDTATVFKLDRTNEDVLFEIMLKYGVFDQKTTEIEINGKTMYRVGNRHMIVCLEDRIDDKDIEEICKHEPRVVVFKEDGFKDDNEKINAEYNLKKAGVEDVKCI